MNRHVALTLCTLVLLAGCGVSQQSADPPDQIEIITMAPLPPLTLERNAFGLRLNLLLHVRRDGSIDNARMIGSSGDPEWDSLALQSVRQWRCAPPLRDGVAADVWTRQPVIVQVQQPVLMTLGQLSSPTRHEADSLYALVSKGGEFDGLFTPALKTVDLATYAGRVRDQLKRLKEHEIAPPLRLGDHYVIFKRFPTKGAFTPPE